MCGVSIDLQKALDTVNGEIFHEKLKHYGIGSNRMIGYDPFVATRNSSC